MRHENLHNDVNIAEDDCGSCHTNRSGSRSRQDKSKVCPASDLEYDYPQWHWLGRENSFKIPVQSGRHSNMARSEQGCQINLNDILPPPPYEVSIFLVQLQPIILVKIEFCQVFVLEKEDIHIQPKIKQKLCTPMRSFFSKRSFFCFRVLRIKVIENSCHLVLVVGSIRDLKQYSISFFKC